ncbi:MAG: type II secretion system F family protein [Lachnospiraceae bacterium]|nr:type II secretion system F family protein [Lachnospiraceae bacterium]
MANYRYKAVNKEGANINGVLDANDEQDLYRKLRDMGFVMTDATLVERKMPFKPLKAAALSELARQIGTLVGAGVPLVRALRIISTDESIKKEQRVIYSQVLTYVLQGMPLSVAMGNMNGVFPELMINMYRAAEAAGTLDTTSMKLADQYLKEDRLNSQIKSATTYPKILSGLIVIVVAILFGFVIPQFEELFAQMESLPIPTMVMLAITDFVKNRWYVLIIAAIAIWLIGRFALKIPKVRFYFDKLKVHVPVFGPLMKTIYTARFARTLSSLYSSGITIITALKIARDTIRNDYIESQFDAVIDSVKAGEPMSVSLERIDGFVKKLAASIKVGEETGQLDSMLNSIADNLDFEAEQATQRMVTFLEPVIIVIMAVIVGFIMFSVIVPIYSSYNAIGGNDL